LNCRAAAGFDFVFENAAGYQHVVMGIQKRGGVSSRYVLRDRVPQIDRLCFILRAALFSAGYAIFGGVET